MDKVISFLKFVFYVSILFLIILSLFPGSLIGFLLYGDIGKQPYLIDNPLGAVINHFIYYFYISILGFCLFLKNENFNKLACGLFFLAIVLEILHLVLPNRAFELSDLVGNFAGVLIAYFLVKIHLFFKKL